MLIIKQLFTLNTDTTAELYQCSYIIIVYHGRRSRGGGGGGGGLGGSSIPVNRPYLGGTVPLLLPLSHRPTFTRLCPTFFNQPQIKVTKKHDSENREYKF